MGHEHIEDPSSAARYDRQISFIRLLRVFLGILHLFPFRLTSGARLQVDCLQ